MITKYLLPSLLHMLTFSNIYLNSLKTMDRSIRSFVRRWLRLPKYTSLGVFYAPCSIGGLAITRLFLTIPVMRLKRVNYIRGNDDPELLNTKSISFRHSFVNNYVDNTQPISCNEVQECFNALHDGKPGIDNIKKNDLTKIGLKNLTARFNVYLLTSTAPSIFKSGLTSLIPKCKHTRDPSKFRHITMSSLINRLFHKILAKRIENIIVLDPRQKAFIKRDGIAENIFLLKNIIYQHKQKLRPLKICLLDVSKAFDFVSHDAIISIANRAGLPKTIIEYIKYAYTNCNTQLKYKKSISPSILVNRGVKQGYPMSPILFNAVIDYVTSYTQFY